MARDRIGGGEKQEQHLHRNRRAAFLRHSMTDLNNSLISAEVPRRTSPGVVLRATAGTAGSPARVARAHLSDFGVAWDAVGQFGVGSSGISECWGT